MAQPKHTPAHDASPAEWRAYLAGRGFVTEDQPKPVTNYKALHGYWVPPRLGTSSKSAGAAARRAPGEGPELQRAWYSTKTLTALYRRERTTFDKLVERVGQIKGLVAEAEQAERLEEHRRLLEPAVEAGLLNQAEADRKLAAWAKAQGISMPKR